MGPNLSVANNGTGPQNVMAGSGHQINHNYYAGNQSLTEEQDYRVMSLLSSQTNYQEHKDRNPKRAHGTCEWFLSHPMFHKWCNEDTPGLLLVSGDPGCGKSVLARAVVDERLLHPKTNLPTARQTCYFFFTRDDENCCTKEAALRAILHQLFQTRPVLRKYGRQGLSDHGEYFHNKFEVLWDILMKATADPQAGQTTCILDALDECENEAQKGLIGRLCDFYSERGETKSKIKFLVTTRPYHDIISKFGYKSQDLTSINLRGEDEDIGKKISEEIDLVIDDEIPRIARAHQPFLDEKTQATLREQLKVKARHNRTYLWLHVMLEELRESHTSSIYDLTNLLESIPTDIDAAYERILNRTTKQVKKHLQQLLLHIIVAAKRPLTLQEVKVAMKLAEMIHEGKVCKSMDGLKLDLRDEIIAPEIRSVCSLFVRVVDSKVYLIHQTARDFLIHRDIKDDDATKDPSDSKGSTPTLWKHSLRPEASNLVMAKVCISYLLLPVLEDSPRTYDDAEEFTKNHVLLQYAVGYWLLHFREAGHVELVEPALLIAATDLFDTDSGKLREWHLEPLHGGMHYMFLYVDGITADASNFQLANAFRKRVEKTRNINEGKMHDETALDDSAPNERKTAVSALLENGWKIEYADSIGWHSLHCAAWEGHDAIVQQLLDNGANIEVEDSSGQTPLLKAAEKGHLSTVRLLLENAANIHAEDRAGNTAVTMAAWDGHEAVLRLLVRKGAKIETNHDPEKTGLFGAVANGKESVVKLLLKAGAGINTIGTKGNTPLGMAAKKGLDKMVQLLLEYNPDIEAKDNKGCTPLYLATFAAALYGDGRCETVIQMLLKKGANLEARNNKGQTVLHAAYRNEKITRLLLKHGACVNAKMDNGKTVLHKAAKRRNEGVLQALIKNGAKIDEKADDGQTALHVAASKGNTAIVQFLVKNGAEINAKAEGGWTALHLAASNDNMAIVQLLVENGADIDAKTDDGRTALDHATLKDNTAIIHFLAENQGRVNAKPDNYTTTVHMAAGNGKPDIMPLLINSGAEIDAEMSYERTADDIARTNWHTDVVQLPSQEGQMSIQPAERQLLVSIDSMNDGSTPPEAWMDKDWLKDLEDQIRCSLIDVMEDQKPVECGLGGVWRSVILRRPGEDVLPGADLFPTPLNMINISSDVEVRQMGLVAEHLSTFDMDKNLGNLYAKEGKMAEAEQMYQQALQGYKKTLGLDHMWTLDTVNVLGLLYADQGKLGEAEQMYQRALQGYEKTLGLDHTSTLETANRLGNLYKSQAQLDYQRSNRVLALANFSKSQFELDNWHNDKVVVLANLCNKFGVASLSLFGCLGRVLLWAGQNLDAAISFEQQIISVNNVRVHANVICDGCNVHLDLSSNRFVCKSCLDIDLCKECYQTYELDGVLSGEAVLGCNSHAFLAVPRDEWFELTPNVVCAPDMSLQGWLDHLLFRFQDPSL